MLLVYQCSQKSYIFPFRTFIEAKAWQHGKPMTSHLRHVHDFFSRSTTSTYSVDWTWNSTKPATRTWSLHASSISLLRYFSAYEVRRVVMFCVWIQCFWKNSISFARISSTYFVIRRTLVSFKRLLVYSAALLVSRLYLRPWTYAVAQYWCPIAPMY